MSIGIPIKLLHEAEGHTVTLELKSGEVYRGQLIDSEDNMNCRLGQVTMTARDGKITNLEQVYIRGSKVRFLIVPDMLRNAPMFKRVELAKQGRPVRSGMLGLGRAGRAASRSRVRGGRGIRGAHGGR